VKSLEDIAVGKKELLLRFRVGIEERGVIELQEVPGTASS
jgi:hypothetical protein